MSVKNFKLLSIVVTIGVLVSVLSMPAFAGLGKIAGTVTDGQTGDPLVGAQVLIVGTMMGAATDMNGQYFILNVPPGTFDLKVTMMGYATQEISGVRSQQDVTSTVDVQVKPTVIEGEVVSVVAVRPVVDNTMTATKVSFDAEVVDNVLPVSELNEILQTSVTTQSMRGANKAGVAYMVDGVNITDIMSVTGGGSDGYTNVKRNTNSTSSATGEYSNDANISVQGRSSDMVQTSSGVSQSTVAEASVIAGTFNAEYGASAGVINIASKSGGKDYSGKIFVRSSAGGLAHAGPDVYTAEDDAGLTAAQKYADHKQSLVDAGSEIADLLKWTDGTYEYGDDPRMSTEFTFGGPLTDNGNFFLAGNFLNDHGRFPGEFQRNLGLSAKLNYDLTQSDRLTVFGKIDDWGQLFGWTNRSYTYTYQFWLEGQPVWDRSGLMSYLKHTHVFNPASFLETTASYVGSEKTWGYKPVDDQLQYDEYGDDWLILDTADKADKYLNDPATQIFNASPGNSPNYEVVGFGNQIRVGQAGYHYENLKSNTLTLTSNYTNQINYNHQLKTGVEYKLNTVDHFSHKVSVPFPDVHFKFETVDFEVNPWSFGTFVQDKIEYEGVIVNLGLRFDAYNMNTQVLSDVFAPSQYDTLASNGQVIMGWNNTEDSETRTYFSPRIGVSHPITENAAMHYSWGIYTTQPNLGYWLRNYNSFANSSLPAVWNSDPDPEKATAYEIGVNVALTNDLGVDFTAYYRDIRNGSAIGYSIGQDKSQTGTDFALYTYVTNWGYRDSRGLEVNLWKRPTAEKYFGVVGLSGNLSLSYSYDKASSNGSNINQEQAFATALNFGSTPDYDFGITEFWPTFSRGYNDWKAKMSLLWDFPFEVKLATVGTFKSPWRYNQEIDVANQRYENKLDGETFMQFDMRLTKYITVAGFRGGVFVEMLNVLDRENILTFDDFDNANLYERDGNPWGKLNRPVSQYGSPLAGIAREMYFGVEVAF